MMNNETSSRYTVTPIKRNLPALAMVLSAGLWAIIVAVVILVVGCDANGPGQEEAAASETSAFAEEEALTTDHVDGNGASAKNTATQQAVAPGVRVEMSPTAGNDASGTVVLTEVEGGDLNMEITMAGLGPGNHGFHVHENGDCSATDASSTGGHFNPENVPHGAPDDEKQHAGDLGNLEADQLGQARSSLSTGQLSLDGPNSVRGRAFVVHRDPDDLTSQPAGAAGVPVACGVVPMQ